jgi:hypothetical protein
MLLQSASEDMTYYTKIEDNLCFDVVTYPRILIAQQFNSNPFSGTTIIEHNSLIRAGGPMFKNLHGALKIWADLGEINGLVIRDMVIDSSTFAGIETEGSYPITPATLEHIDVLHSGTFGIWLHSNLVGSVHFSFLLFPYQARVGFKIIHQRRNLKSEKAMGIVAGK